MPVQSDDARRDWHTPESFREEARRRGAPMGRGLVYEYVRRGVIPHVRVGRKVLIPADALDRMLAARPTPAPAGRGAA